jgi:dTDP-4-amino-4,6-dideoxygalactose transaminase
MEEMDRRGIGTSVHFIPVHLHPYYRDKYGYAQGQFPVAEAAYETLVSLPLHSGLTDDDTGFVIGAIRDVVSGVGVQAR